MNLSEISNIIGTNIYFEEIQSEHTDFILKIRKSKELNRLSKNITKDQHELWLKGYKRKDNDIYWIVKNKKDDKPIGTIAIFDIDRKSRKAELGRWIIKNNFRIHAPESQLVAIKIAFEDLKLNKLYGYVRKGYENILQINKRMGFKIDGILREHYYDGDRFHDLYMISMLREEYLYYKKSKYKKYHKYIKRLNNVN